MKRRSATMRELCAETQSENKWSYNLSALPSTPPLQVSLVSEGERRHSKSMDHPVHPFSATHSLYTIFIPCATVLA